ncbi:hypothetical protein PCE1_000151 [Barthelona sp. PCE]
MSDPTHKNDITPIYEIQTEEKSSNENSSVSSAPVQVLDVSAPLIDRIPPNSDNVTVRTSSLIIFLSFLRDRTWTIVTTSMGRWNELGVALMFFAIQLIPLLIPELFDSIFVMIVMPIMFYSQIRYFKTGYWTVENNLFIKGLVFCLNFCDWFFLFAVLSMVAAKLVAEAVIVVLLLPTIYLFVFAKRACQGGEIIDRFCFTIFVFCIFAASTAVLMTRIVSSGSFIVPLLLYIVLIIIIALFLIKFFQLEDRKSLNIFEKFALVNVLVPILYHGALFAYCLRALFCYFANIDIVYRFEDAFVSLLGGIALISLVYVAYNVFSACSKSSVDDYLESV